MAFCCCGGRADASAELVVRHDFDAVFAMGKQLGEGAYSVVYECRNRRNDDVFAAKVIKKEGLAEDERDDILAEVRMTLTRRGGHVEQNESSRCGESRGSLCSHRRATSENAEA